MPLILNGTTGVSGVDGSAGTPSYQGNDTNTGIFYPAADTIAFAEGGAEIARFDSSGNFGLGVTPNTWTLGKSLSVGDVGSAVFGFGGYNSLTSGAYFNSGWKYSSSSSSQKPALINISDGEFVFSNASAGTAGNAITFSERMRITTGGLFGFGLSDPTTFSSGVAQAVIERTSAGNNTVALALVNRSGTANTSVSLDFNPNTNIALAQIRAFRTDSGFGGATDLRFLNYDGSALAERMRINSSGRVLINNPTSGTQPLTVQADTGNAAASFYSEKAAGNATDIVYFYSLNKGALIGYIGYNGSQVTYNATSDYRLKENVAPMTGALAKVAQLKPCTYTWKQNNTNGQGFIAHELADVFPEAVSGKKDELFEDGSIKPQGIDTSFLVATLTAAIQEQQAMIEELKAKVAALEAK